MRLSSLPFFPRGDNDAIAELLLSMARNADSEFQAEAAITALLQDSQRASDAQTNRCPSPGEIKLWLDAQRRSDAPQYEYVDTPGCGRILPQYSHPDGGPGRCERGWIRHRRWVAVKGLVDADGRPLRQPYDFSGKCKACQPGGWV
jgi:hypothetical protein